jgi:diguanylate cyclase (GGDEF)-like protein
MSTPVLRRRRTVEAFTLLSRTFGLTATVLYVSELLAVAWGTPAGPSVRIACAVAIALMIVCNVAGVINFRRPDGSRYSALSTAQVVGDSLSIAVVVSAIQVTTGGTVWPLLAVSVVTAALRRQLPGALIAWFATSAWLAAGEIVLGARVLGPGDLTMAVAVNFMLAVLSGTQASAFGRQVEELEEARRQLHHQATHDALTGLPNREHLEAYGADLAGRPIAVLLLDLNGFKQVNDVRGHAAGDAVLRAVSARLGTALRPADLVARLGGDEFVVVLPDADRAEADGLADRLRAEIRRPIDLPEGPVAVGVSIGVACRTAGEDTTLSTLASTADAAMYREKAAQEPVR